MNPHELMTAAYSMLYEIETSLVQIIESNMKKHYGLGWKQRLRLRRRFEHMYFHELIPFFARYSSVLPHFNAHNRRQLYAIIPIRNKICHMHVLTHDEYERLKTTYELVNEVKTREERERDVCY